MGAPSRLLRVIHRLPGVAATHRMPPLHDHSCGDREWPSPHRLVPQCATPSSRLTAAFRRHRAELHKHLRLGKPGNRAFLCQHKEAKIFGIETLHLHHSIVAAGLCQSIYKATISGLCDFCISSILSSQSHAAIDMQFYAVDETAHLGGEKKSSSRQFLRLSQAARRDKRSHVMFKRRAIAFRNP